MEADGVDTNLTAGRSVLSGLEGHALGATALGVLEDGAAGGAAVGLGTLGAVRHAVDAVDVGIVGGRNLHLGDGEVGILAGHGRGVVQLGGDAFALEAALGQDVTLAEGVGAGEARELVAAVRAEGTRAQAGPVVAILLGGSAVVVGVARAAVRARIRPTGGRDLLCRKTCDEQRRRALVLHDAVKWRFKGCSNTIRDSERMDE